VKNQKTATSRAFSLIELLVVVAIIGILAALLLPALARAKSNAYKTQCRNNLQQMSLAIQLYAEDNNGRLPGPLLRQVPVGYGSTSSQIFPAFVWKYLALANPAGQEFQTAWPVLTCPAQFKVPVPGSEPVGRRVTYSTKGRINPADQSSRPFGYPAGYTPVDIGAPFATFKLVSIQGPATVYALRDVDMELDNDRNIDWQNRITAKPVHGPDIRNVLYFDGHCEIVHGTSGLE
jgi:prepilin-type N-terminal cleavage/methylation domain-containing protein/prepilin-type processing-associated H-X9-DG protein